jgi:hypothetical protein
VTKWWRRFNRDEAGYEKYGSADIQALACVAAIFIGFFSFMGWLWVH